MTLKNYLKGGAVALFPLIGAGCGSEKPSNVQEETARPNVLLFFTDDNAFWYWGFGGGPELSPNIDRLAAEGTEATRCYVSSSVSTPSRYSLHTGKYAGRCPHEAFLKDYPSTQPYNIVWNTDFDPAQETSFASVLRAAGYYTGFVGKWHLGFDWSKYALSAKDNPEDPRTDSVLKKSQADAIELIKKSGFDYAASIVPTNNDHHPVEALHVHNLDWYAKGALDFLDEANKSGKPWFLIVNITTHHGPCHEPSIQSDIRYTQAGIVEGLEGILPPRASIFERITKKGYPIDFKTSGTVWTDDCVAAILKKVSQLGQDSSTAVIFTSDHNRYDAKATCYEGGVHIPFVMKYPGVIPAKSKCRATMQLVDMYPTILDLCGVKMPDNVKVDGISQWAALKGDTTQKGHEALYFEFGYTRSVMKDNWHYIALRHPSELIENMKAGKVKRAYMYGGKTTDEPCVLRYPHYFDADQLYDLSVDPEEQNNLAYDPAYASKLGEMKALLQTYLSTFSHPFSLENPDAFYSTDKYRALTEKAKKPNMEQFYWFVNNCY